MVDKIQYWPIIKEDLAKIVQWFNQDPEITWNFQEMVSQKRVYPESMIHFCTFVQRVCDKEPLHSLWKHTADNVEHCQCLKGEESNHNIVA